MLPNNILLYILYRVCIKSRPSNNINNVRKKSKFNLLLLLLGSRLNIIIPIKVQLGTSWKFLSSNIKNTKLNKKV